MRASIATSALVDRDIPQARAVAVPLVAFTSNALQPGEAVNRREQAPLANRRQHQCGVDGSVAGQRSSRIT